MKKILLLICAIALLNSVFAEVPKEDPYISVGSDFQVLNWFQSQPWVDFIFDDTTVYMDNNNDGTWDYKWVGDYGGGISLAPQSGEPLKPGALVHSDKPIIFWERLSNNVYISVPPKNNIKTSYNVFDEGWSVIAKENITIYIDECIDGSIEQTLSGADIRNIEFKSSCTIARMYSDDKFYLYSPFGMASLSGTDFYTPVSSISIAVIESNTEIKIDLNNDDAYDEIYVKNKGQHSFVVTNGTHIVTNKPISIYSNYGEHIMPTQMVGSDLWEGGYVLGLFNEYSGFYKNTTLYFDNNNDLIPDSGSSVASNQYTYTDMHTWSDMPLLTFYSTIQSGQHYSNGYYPYSLIYSTSWPVQKLMGQNEQADFNARTFNPFASTTITDVGLTIKIPSNFGIPTGFSLNAKKKNLMTDEILSSAAISKTPVLNEGYYEVAISKSESGMFNQLGPFQYYDITYRLITPDIYGSYEFPVETTYTAPTWQK